MKAIEGALGALMRDKIEQSKHYDITGIPKCLLLRAKLMLEAQGHLYLDYIPSLASTLKAPRYLISLESKLNEMIP